MAISGFPKFKQYTEAQMPLATAVSIGTEVFNTTYQVKMRSNGTSWEWLGIGKSTWANKPATAPLGQIICVTDIGAITTCTKIINGGTNGLDDRIEYWKRAKLAMGIA